MEITPFDLAGSLQAHNQLVQQQRQNDTQNAFAQALPMLQTDPQNALATIGKTGNLAAYSQMSGVINQMDDRKKALAADRSEALSKLLYTLKTDYKDPVIRKAVAQSQAGNLAVHGVTPEQLQSADYSDNGLDIGIRNVMSVKDQIAQSNADRTFQAGRSDHAETARHNTVDEKLAAGRLGVEQANLGISRQKLNQPDFNSPTTVEVSDGKGGTKQVLAQQDKKSGQWVTADEKRAPIDATGINMPDKASGGSRTAAQMLRMVSAAHTIGNELENIAALPSGANAGIFSGQNDTSVRGMLAREITPAEAQSYNTANTGLARALAQMETAGLAPPGSFTKQIEGLTLQQGDTEFNHMQKLASVRQTAEGILDAVANSPIATKKQQEEIAGLKARFSKAIPFTPQDVIKLQRKANPDKTTISERAKQMGLGPQDTAPANSNGWSNFKVHN